jgi:hypothetical protein
MVKRGKNMLYNPDLMMGLKRARIPKNVKKTEPLYHLGLLNGNFISGDPLDQVLDMKAELEFREKYDKVVKQLRKVKRVCYRLVNDMLRVRYNAWTIQWYTTTPLLGGSKPGSGWRTHMYRAHTWYNPDIINNLL